MRMILTLAATAATFATVSTASAHAACMMEMRGKVGALSAG